MKIAAIQLATRLGDVAYNYSLVEKKMAEAIADSPDIVVLPEMWNTSFYPENVMDLADVDGQKTCSFLMSLAKKYHVHIVGGSIANRRDDKLYNTTYIVNKYGEIIGTYDKVHLFAPGKENAAFTAGNKLNLFMLEGIQMASIICYDVRFSEWVRMAALAGAKVLFVPAAWPDARVMHWQILNQARAIENQLFVVAVNNCGRAGEFQFGGHSMIVDPWGNILEQAKEDESIIQATIDISIVEGIRESINIFHDRRPELYRLE